MVIRKVRNKNLWTLRSIKTNKLLGTFKSKKEALKREIQINYFKHKRKLK